MEKQKRYAELKAKLEGYEKRFEQARAEDLELSRSTNSLRDQAMRAEVLGEAGWKELKGKVEKALERLRELGKDQGEAAKAVEILKEELAKLKDGVVDEIRDQYRPAVEKALRAYVGKLMEVAPLGERVIEVQREGQATIARLGIDTALAIEWAGPAVLEIEPFVQRVLMQSKTNGLAVE